MTVMQPANTVKGLDRPIVYWVTGYRYGCLKDPPKDAPQKTYQYFFLLPHTIALKGEVLTVHYSDPEWRHCPRLQGAFSPSPTLEEAGDEGETDTSSWCRVLHPPIVPIAPIAEESWGGPLGAGGAALLSNSWTLSWSLCPVGTLICSTTAACVCVSER